MKTIEELYNEIMANDKLRKEYLKAYDEESIADFLSLHDCPASADELCDMFKKLSSENNFLMLDDETLDEVSGGLNGFIDNSIGGENYFLNENECFIIQTKTNFINNSAKNERTTIINNTDFNIKQSMFIDNKVITGGGITNGKQFGDHNNDN